MNRYEIRTKDGHAVNTIYADSYKAAKMKKIKIYGCHAWEFKIERDKSILKDTPMPNNYRDPEPISR